jgi:hypothetical protein
MELRTGRLQAVRGSETNRNSRKSKEVALLDPTSQQGLPGRLSTFRENAVNGLENRCPKGLVGRVPRTPLESHTTPSVSSDLPFPGRTKDAPGALRECLTFF